jgi:hypothetical protein
VKGNYVALILVFKLPILVAESLSARKPQGTSKNKILSAKEKSNAGKTE